MLGRARFTMIRFLLFLQMISLEKSRIRVGKVQRKQNKCTLARTTSAVSLKLALIYDKCRELMKSGCRLNVS